MKRMKTRAMGQRYRAKTLLWHTAEGRYVEAGEAVDLGHLSPEGIARLLEAGLVEIIGEEEGDGTDDRRNLTEGLQG